MIKHFTFNHFGVNCYLIVDEVAKQCAIVDPAMEATYEDAQLTQYLSTESLQVTHILLTHAHVDHIAGLRQACERFNLPVTMHRDGQKLLRQAEAYGSVMGFDVQSMEDLPTIHADDGTVIMVGNIEVRCLFVPGHCPGSLCFVIPSEKAVLTGDALFHGSIGRTDLPGGNYQELIDNLKKKVMPLPDGYRILPGHDAYSTIADEKEINPFL
jgi:glyoxylase-like metal-dependent hydrolase (beta-lactamase superfamily II)